MREIDLDFLFFFFMNLVYILVVTVRDLPPTGLCLCKHTAVVGTYIGNMCTSPPLPCHSVLRGADSRRMSQCGEKCTLVVIISARIGDKSSYCIHFSYHYHHHLPKVSTKGIY